MRIKQIHLLLILAATYTKELLAQSDSTKPSLLIELGGVNTFYSINYLHPIGQQKKYAYFLRAGGGLISTKDYGLNLSVQALKINARHWKTQIGLGFAYNNNRYLKSNIALELSLCKRRTFRNGFVVLGINPSIHFYPKEDQKVSLQFLLPSIAYGYSLKTKSKK